MSGGRMVPVALPLAFRARHLQRGKRQARDSVALEEVARLDSTGGDGPFALDYRAARGADGAVRLVAPVESSAFAWRRAPEHRLRHAPLADIKLFQMGPNRFADASYFLGVGELGETLASDRGRALARLEGLARGMSLVGGVLHAPCLEPGWMFEVRGVLGGGDVVTGFRAMPNPVNAGYRPPQWLRWCGDPEGSLRARYPRTEGPIPCSGRVDELVPEALACDHAWHRLRPRLEDVLMASGDVAHDMLEDELALRGSLALAVRDWPAERRVDVARAAVRLARVVHGAKSNGNAAMLDAMVKAERDLAAAPAPRPLEERLNRQGVSVPANPAAEGEDPPRRFGR